MSKTFTDYQNAQFRTAMYGSPMYPFASLAEEVGEVLGKLNKYVRKNQVSYETAVEAARWPSSPDTAKLRDDLIKELGDVLWNLSAACQEIDVPLELVAGMNVIKLADREARGVINGEGDKR